MHIHVQRMRCLTRPGGRFGDRQFLREDFDAFGRPAAFKAPQGTRKRLRRE